jgi:hypothetical protein
MKNQNIFARIFGVFIDPRTYGGILYQLLALPLGIVYFTLLVTGFSLGIPLILIWVGIPILLLVMVMAWGLTAFERVSAIGMLGVKIPPMSRPTDPAASIWKRFINYLSNPVTWKGLVYLLIKLPIGIGSFTAVVTLLTVPLAMIFSPMVLFLPDVQINMVFWRIDTLPEITATVALGFVLLVVSIHILNFFSYLLGELARVMLGNAVPAQPVTPAAPAVEQQELVEAVEHTA